MFNGAEYVEDRDSERLQKQHERIKNLMLDGSWRTLDEIRSNTSDPVASISAQLRHLRKERFGSWIVERRKREGIGEGLYEYRLRAPGSGCEKKINRSINIPNNCETCWFLKDSWCGLLAKNVATKECGCLRVTLKCD